MTSIMDALTDLAAEVTRRGIPATLDPRDLDAPGALVEITRVGTDDLLCGDVTAEATVYLLVPDNGRALATANLLDMFDKVRDLTTGAEPVELALPDSAPLPAFRLSPITLT